ncbi:hypothetical protein ABKA04_007454 [Annulohypoxylon sp. FPYF3050]
MSDNLTDEQKKQFDGRMNPRDDSKKQRDDEAEASKNLINSMGMIMMMTADAVKAKRQAKDETKTTNGIMFAS